MKESFAPAIEFCLHWEGWRTDDPNDAGKLTIWGITQRDWPGVVDSLKAKSREESREAAKEFYRNNYWNVCGCDALPLNLDIVVFDAAVNQGTGWGNRIAAAAQDWKDALILRLDRYDDLRPFDRYGRGWCKRLVALRDYIISGYEVLDWDGEGLLIAPK